MNNFEFLIVVILLLFLFWEYKSPRKSFPIVGIDIKGISQCPQNQQTSQDPSQNSSQDQNPVDFEDDPQSQADFEKCLVSSQVDEDVVRIFTGGNSRIDGDELLTRKMIDNGRRAKQSIDIRSKFTKNSFLPYIEKELRDSENSQSFWDDDSLEYMF